MPVAAACAGLLAVTSMINARGTDLRGGRHTDLIGLVSEQRSDVRDLQRNVASLQRNVDSLAETVQGTKINQVRRQITAAEAAASVLPMQGPGLMVTLDDSPHAQAGVDGVDPNLLVVHQQDIQAVVNALWSGGAAGISIENQRIISTTGHQVRRQHRRACSRSRTPRRTGSGRSATPIELDAALEASTGVQAYIDYTQSPYNLGYDVSEDPSIRLPGYTGPLDPEVRPSRRLSGDPQHWRRRSSISARPR